MLMKRPFSILILGLILMVLSTMAESADDETQIKKELEDTYKQSYGKMVNDNPEAGRDAILSLLPSQEELSELFGPNAELISPECDKYRAVLNNSYTKISSLLKSYGPIRKLSVEPSIGSAVDLLKKKLLFPKNVPVYSLHLDFDKCPVHLGPFAHLHDHWIFLPDLTDLVMAPTYSQRNPDKSGYIGPLPEGSRAQLIGNWKSEDGNKYSTLIRFSPVGSFSGLKVLDGREVGRFRGEWYLESCELRQYYIEETPPTPGRPPINYSTIIQLTKEVMRLQTSDRTMVSYLRVNAE